MGTTPKWAIPFPEGSEVPNVPQDMEEMATALDGVAMDSAGTLASRPTAGTSGRYYYATDDTTTGPSGTLFRDNGAAWERVGNQQVPQVRVTHSTTSSSTGYPTYDVLAFDTESYDLGTPSTNMHDTVTNNSRLTCRVAGLYTAVAYFDCTGGAEWVQTKIRLNGTTDVAKAGSGNSAGGQPSPAVAVMDYRLAVGDYIEVLGITGSAGRTISNRVFSAKWVSV